MFVLSLIRAMIITRATTFVLYIYCSSEYHSNIKQIDTFDILIHRYVQFSDFGVFETNIYLIPVGNFQLKLLAST